MSAGGLIIDCGRAYPTRTTKSWKISPAILPELIERCGIIDPNPNFETEVQQYADRVYEMQKNCRVRAT
jgi:hypothetical protein